MERQLSMRLSQDEATRDMIFLKFARSALNMKYTVGSIMGAINEIVNKKENKHLSEHGIVNKICEMQDQDRESGPLSHLEEKMYRHFMSLSAEIKNVAGDSVCNADIKNVLRQLLQEGRNINANIVLNHIFDTQDELSVGQSIEGDTITILNPSLSESTREQNSMGPQSDMTTNMGSGAFIPPKPGESLTPVNNSHYQAVCTGPSVQPSTSQNVDEPPTNQQDITTASPDITNQTVDMEENTSPSNRHSGEVSSNGSQNSTGSSLPLGASASTYQGPRATAEPNRSDDPHAWIARYQTCYDSLEGLSDENRKMLAKQMLCMTVYPSLECLECGCRSKVEDNHHHEDLCQFKDPNQANTSRTTGNTVEIAQASISHSHGASTSTNTAASYIAQSNSGFSGDLNQGSHVVPIEDDTSMSIDNQIEEDHKLALELQEYENRGSGDRQMTGMGASGGPRDTEGSLSATTRQLSSQACVQEENTLNPDECKVCKSRQADRVLLQCKHFICQHCVKTTKSCGVCVADINGCGFADLSFRRTRGPLTDPSQDSDCICRVCKVRLGDIVLVPCGHFVCDVCRPVKQFNSCKLCGLAVTESARTDINFRG